MKKVLKKANRLLLVGGLIIGAFSACFIFIRAPAQAATGVNQYINFQGRLLNSQGATVPDGFYNIQFKIYQDGTGQSVGNPSGTLEWTEEHLNNNTQGVRVVNGYLSVQLGSVNAFGSSIDWNQDTLWLSMNIGGTGASCTPFSSCSPDGEMVPMQRLTSAPYALNSGLLGGLSSAQFLQLAQGVQTDASNVSSIFVNKTGTGNLVQLQANGTDIFSVSTSSNTINIGVTGSTNANSTIHIADSTSGVQNVTIGSTNSTSTTTIRGGSGGINLTGIANINTSGTANTNIGNSSGGTITIGATSGSNLVLQDADWNITGAGAASFTSVTSSGDVSFSSSTANMGSITKQFIVGTNGVNTSDVVIMTSIPDIQQTTITRDSRVFGVSKSTVSSGSVATIVTSGNYTVSVDLGAVSIGDQLVTSTTAGRATVDNNATTGIIGIALSSKSAGANGAVSVLVRPVGGQYSPTFRGTSNSATAFQVQNSSGINFFNIDTSTNAVNIGATGSTSTNTTIHIADSSAGVQTVIIGSTNSTSTTTIQSGTNGIHLDGNTTIEGAHTFNTGTGQVSLNGDTVMASDKNFTQNGAGSFSTGSGANSLNGDTTVTGTKTFTVNGGNTTLGANLDVTGSTALKKGTDFSTIGTTNNANFANASLIRLTGASAQTITGIANGRDGYLLTIVNASTAMATLKSEDTNSSAANRITNGSGGDISIPVGASIILIYDGAGSRWHAASTTDLQTAYNNSTGPQITLTSANGGLVVQDASSPIGADLFTVQSNGGTTKYLNVTATTVAVNNNLTVSGTYNTNTFTSTALQFGGASGTVSSSAGNLTIQAASTNSLLLDTAGAGTVSIANSGATTVNVATNDVAHAINIGTGGASTSQTITIGSNGTVGSSVTIKAGSTGGIHLAGNTIVDANNNFTQSGTGSFSTGSGANTLNGDTTIAANKNFTQSGTGTFSTGSGTNTLNGDTNISSNKSFTANGTALFKNATNSTTAFQVQNAAGSNLLNIDTSSTVNLVTNGDIESQGTGGWTAKGSSTLTSVTTQQWQGNSSLQIETTTAANDGARYTANPSGGTQYTLSLYAKVASGSITDVNIGRQDNTTNGEVDCLTARTLTTSWTRFSCSFTTNATINTNYIYIKKTGVSAETFFIDGMQLQTGSVTTGFDAGGALQLSGVVNSPVTFRNKNDSATAFQIQNAAGTQYFAVNTFGGISIGTSTAAVNLSVSGDVSARNGSIVLGSGNIVVVEQTITGTSGGTITIQSRGTVPKTTLVVKGMSGQSTSNLQEWQDSNAVVLANIKNDGSIVTKGNANLIQTTSNSATAFQVQNSSSFNVMAVDTSANRMKVYDGAATQAYVDIYYDTGTSSAILAASTGTTQIGGTGPVNITAGSSAAVSITGHATSSWLLDGGDLTIDVVSASTPNLNLGTGAQAKNVTIGNGTGATATSVQCGTGTCGFGNNATDHSTTLGSTTGTSATTVQSGTGGITINGNTTISTGKLLVVGTNSSDLTCTSGGIYYNTTTNRFRGCENGTWVNIDNFADVQTYTSGNTTWNKPTNATAVQVIVVGGGGGGGGGGARNGGQERNGGGGGGGGVYKSHVFAASDIASSAVASVGTAGSAGSGAASSGSAGGNGGVGGTSCFSTTSSCGGTLYISAYGGGGGGGGNQAGATGGGGGGGGGAGAAGSTGSNTSNTGATGGSPAGGAANASTAGGAGAGGGSANSGAGTAGNAGGAAEYGGAGGGGAAGGNATSGNGGSSIHGAGGGGAGGSTNSGNATGNPGAGGVSQSNTSGGGGAAGTAGCTVGGTGGTGSSIKAGSGGGGGGANGGGGSTGCAGGDGGAPGGGGGGGGSGSSAAGAGGAGGSGRIWVISW